MSDTRTTRRAQNKIRRILMLIEVISPLRMPFTIRDAMHRLEERSGSKLTVCARTIQRDLELLVEMNYITVYRKSERDIPGLYKTHFRITINIDILTAKAKP